jgi:hypothetical protein
MLVTVVVVVRGQCGCSGRQSIVLEVGTATVPVFAFLAVTKSREGACI